MSLNGSPEPGSRHTVGHTQQAPHSTQLCVLGVEVTYVLPRPRGVSRQMPPWWHHRAFAEVSRTFLCLPQTFHLLSGSSTLFLIDQGAMFCL